MSLGQAVLGPSSAIDFLRDLKQYKNRADDALTVWQSCGGSVLFYMGVSSVAIRTGFVNKNKLVTGSLVPFFFFLRSLRCTEELLVEAA